jgi:hypothetical protein
MKRPCPQPICRYFLALWIGAVAGCTALCSPPQENSQTLAQSALPESSPRPLADGQKLRAWWPPPTDRRCRQPDR